MEEDLKKAIVGFSIGVLFLMFGILSQFIRDKNKIEPITKKEKISKGIKNVIYVGYVTRGILGIIVTNFIVFIYTIFYI